MKYVIVNIELKHNLITNTVNEIIDTNDKIKQIDNLGFYTFY